MANQEHAALVLQGEAWRRWREENVGVTPDLSGANLHGAKLINANLNGADLYWANLTGAQLIKADLSEADLRQADLSAANLTWANLSGADLSEADLDETLFVDTSLINVLGLDACEHHGPSVLDHRTLARSGQLPLPFLRGCGLPEKFIEYLPSLLDQPIQFYSCFISYSNKDQDFADRLYADLQNQGVRCWFAPHKIQGGKKIHEQIDEAIRIYDRLLLVLSEHSMESEWVQMEIAHARKKELNQQRKVLFPICDGAVFKDMRVEVL
jgi:uncharacterized protein YjbI with pentapeptide repeats